MASNKLKEFAPSIVSGFVLMLTIGAVSTINMTQSNTLLAQQNKKVELQNKIDQMAVENNTTTTKVKAQANGIDSDRVKKDDESARELLDKVFTWKSYKEYNQIRNDLMKKYNLVADSSFMTTFMPEIVNETIDGKDYNRIDVDGYNISFNNMTSYVVSINEATKVYEYFVVVNATSKSNNGGNADISLALQYRMTENQQIMDLTGYTLD